eukprot:gene2638-3043_t
MFNRDRAIWAYRAFAGLTIGKTKTTKKEDGYEDGVDRCKWVSTDETYLRYHDNEWGKAQRDPIKLFEKICLEGQSAGLSWLNILKKRDNYRAAFLGFDPVAVSKFTKEDIDRLMLNEGLIRYRLKLDSIVKNAKAYNKMTEAGEDFSKYIWSFVNDKPQINRFNGDRSTCPTRTEASDAMAKGLKSKGFSFIGTTTCYAFMQSYGLVNDHSVECFCHPLYVKGKSASKSKAAEVDDDDEDEDVKEDIKPNIKRQNKTPKETIIKKKKKSTK